jgi:LacI family transcriptional regulator
MESTVYFRYITLNRKGSALKTPTINDVAAAAGVSRATASRALSNYGRINAETVKRVQAAAEKIGYKPNELARSMRSGRTKTLGLVVIADFTNVFFDRATKGIVDRAREYGYQVLISNTDENIAIEREAVKTQIEKQVDGMIVVPSTAATHDHLSNDNRNGKPLVVIDRAVPGINATSITTNDFIGCDEAVRHATSLGHKRLGFLIATAAVSGFTNEKPIFQNTAIEERVNGFMNGAIDSKISPKNTTWVYSEDDPEVAKVAVIQLLDSKNAPTVIFTSNNDMALAVLKVVGERRLQLGKDVSLVTVDDSQWLEAISPGITVVERPVDELAREAVDQLISLIEEPNQKPKKIVLPTKLLVRGSVANLSKTS